MTVPSAGPDEDERDREDMASLAAGQDAALDSLMARYGERLHRYLFRLVQNESEAADLAEEAFVRVYQNRAKYKAENRFSTWLYAIATNLARDLHRFKARHPNVSLDADPGDPGRDFRELLPQHTPGPREVVAAKERAEAVRRALAVLPEELRVPIVLAEYEGKSQAEIAAILSCTPKAVEMRIYRARQELRRRLADLL